MLLCFTALIIYFLTGDKMYYYDAQKIYKVQNNFCIDENNYENEMQDKVLPFIHQFEKSGYFKGTDNVNLFYRKFEIDQSKASIVIVHGFTENTYRYNELIYYFLKQNYSVYIYDQRCHGLSERLSDTYNMIYVKKFDDYVQDLKKFLDEIVHHSNIFLYGHSMGGTVIIRFLQTCQSSIKFCLLSAPMLEIMTKPYPPKVADLYSKAENLIGAEKKYCPGHSDFNFDDRLNDPIYKNFPRYIYSVNYESKNPKLITNGASFGWFKESTKAIKNIFKPENTEKIKIPIALFQYGNDKTVLPNGQNKFATLVQSCEIYKIDNTSHNIYYMDNKILSSYLKKVFDLCESFINTPNS